MSKLFVKDIETDELAQKMTDLALPRLHTTREEKEYLAGASVEEMPEAHKIMTGYGIFIADVDTIRIYPSGKVRQSQKIESAEEKTRTLEAEVKLLRELLTDKSCGVGLMRISLIFSVTFFLFYLIGVYTPLILVHPVISILGLIGSVGFFCIGWINSKP